MKGLISYASSSVGKKQIMGISGLLWCFFLVGHLSGNFALFAGPVAFNTYAHFLMSLGGLLYVLELGLLFTFLLHAYLGIKVSLENKKARPIGYAGGSSNKGGAHLLARMMAPTGIVILVFVILHLIHFKYGSYYETIVNGVAMRDVYRTVMEQYSSLGFTAWYVIAMVLLGFHLTHAFQSSIQSLGLYHTSYTPIIKKISVAFGTIISLGFIIISVWAYTRGGI